MLTSQGPSGDRTGWPPGHGGKNGQAHQSDQQGKRPHAAGEAAPPEDADGIKNMLLLVRSCIDSGVLNPSSLYSGPSVMVLNESFNGVPVLYSIFSGPIRK